MSRLYRLVQDICDPKINYASDSRFILAAEKNHTILYNPQLIAEGKVNGCHNSTVNRDKQNVKKLILRIN